MFAYRHETTQRDLTLHRVYRDQPRCTVAITGSGGLIGSQLVPLLTTGGHIVKRLVRHEPRNADEIYWNPARGEIDAAGLEGVDAVVHLAGENIGAKRWSEMQKQRIMESHTQGARLISETLAAMDNKPRVLVTTSTAGYYGDRGAERLTEKSSAGSSAHKFLPQLCQAWESATKPAAESGIRVVTLRLGTVLSMRGGMLAQMLLPFQAGFGGTSGRHIISWLALDDAIGIMLHAIMNEDMVGVYNAAAPTSVTNREFARTLGRILQRPALIPIPGFALRLLYGERANELLLASADMDTMRLQKTGYAFRYPELEGALRHVLGRTTS